jgi:O-antigen/teichoic acid export membrane protein
MSRYRSLKQRALSAGGWTAASVVASQGIRVVTTLVMTRLLAPEVFGLMAIAVMVNVIAALLTDLGIHQNIIQSKRSDDPVFLNTAWTVQIIRGAIIWTAGILFAIGLHVVGQFGLLPQNTVYSTPVLPWVLVASSFAVMLAGLQSTKVAMAERGFNQRQLLVNDLTSQVSGLVFMMVVGALTHSIWALVAGQMLNILVNTCLGHLRLPGQRNRLAWDKSARREILSFGKWVFVSSFIGVFALQADRIVLGGLVSAATLGQVAVAGTIVATVEGVFSKLYSTILMPALSEIARGDRGRLKEVFYRVRVPTDLALLFCAGLLASTGQQIIAIIYDHRYRDAGWMLEILAFSLVWTRYGATQQLYMALGVPKYVALINMARFVSVFALLPLGFYFGGIKGSLWGFAMHQSVIAMLSYRFNAELGLNDTFRDLVVLVALPIGYGAGLSLQLLA